MFLHYLEQTHCRLVWLINPTYTVLLPQILMREYNVLSAAEQMVPNKCSVYFFLNEERKNVEVEQLKVTLCNNCTLK